MTRFTRFAVVVGFLLPAVSADLNWAQQEPPREGYRDRYGVLSERNIFLRDRGRRRRWEPTSQPAYGTRPAEDSYVLRGVVFEDDQFHAYVENLSGYSVLKLGVGDTVASGKIAQIEINAIEYELSGRRTRIEIGQTLTGGQAASFETILSETSGSTTQPASAPAINPNDPNLTIEQKMKLRRQQELNRK
jgi:hypothetical protein